MGKLSGWMTLLAFIACFRLAVNSQAQTEKRIVITAIMPSVNTGQDYSPWLNDDLNDLVRNHWVPTNFPYVDVTLKLAEPTSIT
ncbi:hypothetical protein DNI29_23780, partial [Hymenobacter sediminis]|uniref:hypothetical protein n=1 Tax=Hymenobacter sediminis TaxID=2218621 RepID=UPI00105812AC